MDVPHFSSVHLLMVFSVVSTLLDIVSKAAMNIGAQISVRVLAFNFFVCIRRNGIAGSKGNSHFFEEVPHYSIVAAPF